MTHQNQYVSILNIMESKYKKRLLYYLYITNFNEV